jgi:uncharacterized protein YjiS (DUF1127 family)
MRDAHVHYYSFFMKDGRAYMAGIPAGSLPSGERGGRAMTNWITRTLADWRAASRHRSEYAQLAAMPDHLLYDIGVTRDGIPSLARQLRSKSRR